MLLSTKLLKGILNEYCKKVTQKQLINNFFKLDKLEGNKVTKN